MKDQASATLQTYVADVQRYNARVAWSAVGFRRKLVRRVALPLAEHPA